MRLSNVPKQWETLQLDSEGQWRLFSDVRTSSCNLVSFGLNHNMWSPRMTVKSHVSLHSINGTNLPVCSYLLVPTHCYMSVSIPCVIPVYSNYCLHVTVNSCRDICYGVDMQAVRWRWRLKLIVMMLWRLRQKLMVMISLIMTSQVSVCFASYEVFCVCIVVLLLYFYTACVRKK